MKMHFPVVPLGVRLLSPKGLFWQVKERLKGEKAIYITFDDGPIPEVTPKVLEILAQFDAKATFFCVGDNVRKHPDVFKSILDQGHSVGNHTYCHLNGNKVDQALWYEDIEHCDELVKSNLFRPPHGRITWNQVIKLRKKYNIIMWSVLTGDYNHSLTKEMVAGYAIKYGKEGSIIVFHDSIKAEERMLYALPKVLEYFKSKGFVFKRIILDLM